MIELRHNALVFSFPKMHPKAKLQIEFERTLRVPDDGRDYPLPPGFSAFPLRHVDDHADRVPRNWLKHGGVMLPMYQAEAMWLNFDTTYVSRQGTYPFAIKIATGKINAISGEPWTPGLNRKPKQDYVVAPEQPWLDGYCVAEGVIRQFVAMPLGAGFTAEEQLTGKGEVGGLQIAVFPMKAEVFERRFPKQKYDADDSMRCQCLDESIVAGSCEMGVAPGGRIRQQIFDDPFDPDDWDLAHSSRCFVHLADSLTWQRIAGSKPPTKPITAGDYANAGLPWFDFYEERPTVAPSAQLTGLKSVQQMVKEKLPGSNLHEEQVTPERIINLRRGLGRREVRQGNF